MIKKRKKECLTEEKTERERRAEINVMLRFPTATHNSPQSALPIDVAQLVAADGA